MFEWGDLRHFVAVARMGSTLAAAQEAGVSQSTVARRISALEEALQVKLFERLQSGSRLTDQGRSLLPAAEQAQAAIQAFSDAAEAGRRQLAGVIRFTLAPEAVEWLMSEPMRAFMQRHPGVRIELMPTEAKLDIAAGEADVALRAGPAPSDPNLIIRKIMDVRWAGYCSRDYAAAHGMLDGPPDLARHAVIGVSGPVAAAPPLRWLSEQVSTFVCHASSLYAMVSFAKLGLGVALLPTLHGDVEEDLVRCMPTVAEICEPAWIITREDTRRTPAVRAFIDFLSAHVAAVNRDLQARGTERLAQA